MPFVVLLFSGAFGIATGVSDVLVGSTAWRIFGVALLVSGILAVVAAVAIHKRRRSGRTLALIALPLLVLATAWDAATNGSSGLAVILSAPILIFVVAGAVFLLPSVRAYHRNL